MSGPPDGWQNPIVIPAGSHQSAVVPTDLLPSRSDLWQSRLDQQLQLIQAGTPRWTPITVTPEGVIIDGHHAVRAAADLGLAVGVLVEPLGIRPVGKLIQELPLRAR